jgi:hypothetical protein
MYRSQVNSFANPQIQMVPIMSRPNPTIKSWFKSTSLLLCTLSASGALLASEPVDTQPGFLSEIGLANLEVIGESQASEVRGLGVGASGTSILIGSLVDPSTGSTANFFQIQSSGANGATASYSNNINASFGWTVNGIFQRFQAEIGGFGIGFAR